MQTKKWLPHLNVEMVWLWNDWIICLQNIPNVTRHYYILALNMKQSVTVGNAEDAETGTFSVSDQSMSITRLVKEVETMPEVGREVMAAALCT